MLLGCRCLNACVSTGEKRIDHRAKQVDTEQGQGLGRPPLAVDCDQHEGRTYQSDVELALRNTHLSLYWIETYPLNPLSCSPLFSAQSTYPSNFRCLCYDPSHVPLLSFPLPSFPLLSSLLCMHKCDTTILRTRKCRCLTTLSFLLLYDISCCLCPLFSFPPIPLKILFHSLHKFLLAYLFCDICLCLPLNPRGSDVIQNLWKLQSPIPENGFCEVKVRKTYWNSFYG